MTGPDKPRSQRPRVIGPEDEDRRTDRRKANDPAKESGVESLPDGEEEAARESDKARDD